MNASQQWIAFGQFIAALIVFLICSKILLWFIHGIRKAHWLFAQLAEEEGITPFQPFDTIWKLKK